MLDYFLKYAPDLVNEPPVVTVTQVEALQEPDCFVEIEAVALLCDCNGGEGDCDCGCA